MQMLLAPSAHGQRPLCCEMQMLAFQAQGFPNTHPKGFCESCRIQIFTVQWSPTQAEYDCSLLRLIIAAKKLDLSRKVISLLTQEIQDIPESPGDLHHTLSVDVSGTDGTDFLVRLHPSSLFVLFFLTSSQFMTVHDSHHSSSLGFLSWSSFVRTSNRGNSSETNERSERQGKRSRDQEIKAAYCNF